MFKTSCTPPPFNPDFCKSLFIFLFLLLSALSLYPEEFITVKNINGRWYFISPDNKSFISRGVNVLNKKNSKDKKTGIDSYAEKIKEKYGSFEEWGNINSLRYQNLGFNTLGGWSNIDYYKDLYNIRIIYPGKNDWSTGQIDDYFSDDFRDNAEKEIYSEIIEKDGATDKNLIGYCIGNELRWGIDWRSSRTIVFDYLNSDKSTAGKKAIIDFMKTHYNDNIKKFSFDYCVRFKSWEEAVNYKKYKFTTLNGKKSENEALLFIARKYYQTTTGIIKKYDPDHLILGSRFIAAVTPKEVLIAAGEYCDVINVNYYKFILNLERSIPVALGYTDTVDTLRNFYEISGGKPILITEFGFRGKTSNNPSTRPFIYPVYYSQKQRGKILFSTIKKFMKTEYIVGYHLFQWMDQPKNGREMADGENNNWGIVDINDEIYPEFAEFVKSANNIGTPD